MRRYLGKTEIFGLLTTFLIYLIAPAIIPEHMATMFTVMGATFVVSAYVAICGHSDRKFIYPLFLPLLILPTIPMYYNDSAYIWLFYVLFIGYCGLFIGWLTLTVARIKTAKRKAE